MQSFGPSEEPQPEGRKRNPLLVGCLAVVGILVLLTIVGTCGGGGSGSGGDQKTPATGEGDKQREDEQAQKEEQQAQAQKEKEQAQKEEEQAQAQREEEQAQTQKEKEQAAVASIGEEVAVGDTSYTVTNAEVVTELPDPYELDPPMTGNFVLIDFTFANNGNEPVTVSDLGMYLYDSQDRQYETDTDASFNLPDDKSISLLDRVNPGLSQEVQTVYSVPPDAQGLELEVTSGFFAAESARIDLGEPVEDAASAEQQFISEYYAAVGREDWAATYSMLNSDTQAQFTEEEWIRKQQAREDASGAPPVESATITDTSEEGEGFIATVTLAYEDGTEASLPGVAVYFEDGEFKRHLTDEDLTFLRDF